MGDISSCLPTDSQTVTAIYISLKVDGDTEPPRGYLGASIIGHECDRYLWYDFNDCVQENFPGRLYRLFETGHLQEGRMVRDLRSIGVTVHDVDDKGEQFGMSDVSGHFSGHMDGCCLGIPEAPKTWHVFEGKTHNDKYFKILKKKGVKVGFFKHYAQMQMYMHKTSMKRALYMAVNKNTDELYTERIHYSGRESNELIAKARRIILARHAPERCVSKPGTFTCRFCPASDLCWGESLKALPVPYISCRQCCHSTPETDTDHGRWSCNYTGATISREKQLEACPHHIVLPDLIHFAKPTDSTDNSIEFTNKDGSIWVNGDGDGKWSTKELMACTPSSLNDKTQIIKEEFSGSEVVYGGVPIGNVMERYESDLSVQKWSGPASMLNKAWESFYNESLANVNPTATQHDGKYMAKEIKGRRVAVIVKCSQTAWILELTGPNK